MPQDISTILQQLWGAFQTAAPWLTGGLAGAVLTYTLNQRSARRKQPRLVVQTEKVDYSIATRDEALKSLRVFYEGEAFESLALFQFSIENSSDRTAKTSPFLFVLSEDTQIVNRSSLVQPVARELMWQSQTNQPGAYMWDAGELKPGDSARLRLLLSPSANIQWYWRGDDDIEIASFGADSTQEFERELRNIVAWIALYVFSGAIPIIGQFTQALLIVLASPKIVQLFSQWRGLLRLSRSSQSPTVVVTGSRNEISVTTDSLSGTGAIAIR